MNDRKYVIISAEDVPLIDFSKVCETSAETLRYSVDGTKTFVKYNCECDGACDCCPDCVEACPSKGELLSLPEIHAILDTPEWTQEMPDGP